MSVNHGVWNEAAAVKREKSTQVRKVRDKINEKLNLRTEIKNSRLNPKKLAGKVGVSEVNRIENKHTIREDKQRQELIV